MNRLQVGKLSTLFKVLTQEYGYSYEFLLDINNYPLFDNFKLLSLDKVDENQVYRTCTKRAVFRFNNLNIEAFLKSEKGSVKEVEWRVVE